MKEETKEKRRAQIEEAAYALLEARGFEGTSMLSIAKAAKASNETLYKWYGDKTGLFAAMVESNARRVSGVLKTALEGQQGPVETLRNLAPTLLGMLLSRSAIALNKAAAADTSGKLGTLLAQHGRETLAPLIAAQMERAMDERFIEAPNPKVAALWYISLVVGDSQIRRVTGALAEPRPDEVRAMAGAGVAAFFRLCGTPAARIEPDPRMSML